jgi:catechol 2,3-dioxygenase-like lactoylglutathione lyase family enzyme
MTAPRLNAFSVVVADMATTLAFYRSLGLDIPAAADSEPHVDVELGGGIRLMFDTADVVRSMYPDWHHPGPTSFGMAMAFECASPADVDATHARLVDHGAVSAKEPWDAFWGMRYAVVHDPDGNPVDLYALLPT